MPLNYRGRTAPQNTEEDSLTGITRMPRTPMTEKRILARLILKGSRENGIGAITPEDFYDICHKKIFEAYINVIRASNEFDEFTILNEAKLLTTSEAENQRLIDTFKEVCTTGGTPNLDDEIANLKLYTKKRRLLEVATTAIQESKKNDPDVGLLIDTLTKVKAGNVKLKSFQKVVDDTLELLKLRWQRGGEIMGISTTIENIDRATGGLMPGETVMVAGRPSAGKSMLLSQIALENIKKGKKVLYFSLEMQEIEVLERMVAHELGIDSNVISNTTDDNQKNQIMECLEKIKTYPITFADNIFTLDDIISSAWYLKETTGVDLVVIDYLQLINPGNKRFQSDNSAVSHVSRQLKETAQQLGIPILIGSQLSRKTDMREDQSPRLSDLRDCLDEDSLVPTKNGIKKIKNIKKGDIVIGFAKDFKLGERIVKNKWNTGVKDVYKLVTKTGRQILSTENHRFISQHSKFDRGVKCLKDISVGDKIQCVGRYPELLLRDSSSDKYYILGLMVGNGWFGKYGKELTMPLLEDCLIVKEIADKEFGLDVKISKYKNANAYRIYFTNDGSPNKFNEWIKKLKLNGVKKHMPKKVFNLTNEETKYFLQGLIQADGSVKTHNGKFPYITFCSVNDDIAYGVQHLLLKFGIISYLGKEKMSTSGEKSNYEFINRVNIGANDIIKFNNEIGLRSDKGRKLKEVCEGYKSNKVIKNGMLYWDTVKSIEYIGPRKTIDIEIETSPYFCVNDFISHNSGSIEQDASIVMALHYHEIMEDIQKDNGETLKDKDGMSKQKSTGKWDTTGILLLKNRRGRANFEVPVMFDRPTSTFSINSVEALSDAAIKIFAEAPNNYVD
jgi:replicative DNA helicase